ncbi:MAG: MmcQ/YjbR family DNA-binding protein [Porphyrobacter sp.]|nr:MmcQ/YjbR family DNA-binding protein [Porphyrobacter sp.]
MVTDDTFRTAALALSGVSEAAHFDRRAYRRRKIFATLAADGRTANLLLPAECQSDLIDQFPHLLRRVPNKWGDRGWTTMELATAQTDDMRFLLHLAFEAGA